MGRVPIQIDGYLGARWLRRTERLAILKPAVRTGQY